MNNGTTSQGIPKTVFCAMSVNDLADARSFAAQSIAAGIPSEVVDLSGGDMSAAQAACTGGCSYIGIVTGSPVTAAQAAAIGTYGKLYLFCAETDGNRHIYNIDLTGGQVSYSPASAGSSVVTLAQAPAAPAAQPVMQPVVQPYPTMYSRPVVAQYVPQNNDTISVGKVFAYIGIGLIAVFLVMIAIVFIFAMVTDDEEIDDYDDGGYHIDIDDDGEDDAYGNIDDTFEQPEVTVREIEYELADDLAFTEGDIEFSAIGSGDHRGEFVVTGYSGTDKIVKIPAEFKNKPVWGIGGNAFAGNMTITEVEIPESCEFIDEFAFSDCTALKTVSIPSTVTFIGDGAFMFCERLESITLPEGVDCVHEGLFECCYSLRDVTIPDSVVSVEAYAFSGTDITEAEIPDSVKALGSSAFMSCYELKKISIGDGVTVLPDYMCAFCEKLSEVEFGKNAAYIGADAFMMTGLKQMTLPEGIAGLETNVFRGCTELTSVALPSTLEIMYSYNFAECPKLKEITVADGNKIFMSDDGVLYTANHVTLLAYPAARTGSCVISEDTEEIYIGAFMGVTGLKSVEIPGSVKLICESAFENTGLESVVVPEGVGQIDSRAFANCPSLKEVSLPASLAYRGYGIFADDPKLAKFTVAEKAEHFETDGVVLIDLDDNEVIAVAGAYKGEIVVPDGIVGIADASFKSCTGVTAVTLPAHCKTIGNNAFDGCSGLTAIELNSDLKTIGMNAFSGAKKLKSVELPDNLGKLGQYAFKDCESLSEIGMGGGYDMIGSGTFEGCKKLEKIVIPDSVKTLYPAFYGCTSLKSIVLGDGLEKIYTEAFFDCANVEEIYYPAGVKFETGLIEECGKLTDICYGGSQEEWEKGLVVSDPANTRYLEVNVKFDCDKDDMIK